MLPKKQIKQRKNSIMYLIDQKPWKLTNNEIKFSKLTIQEINCPPEKRIEHIPKQRKKINFFLMQTPP